MPHFLPAKILRPEYLVFIILAAYLFFGYQHLTRFITADEHYWIYERIPEYWDAIAEGKWKKTYVNDKPGVSLALVSGIGLLYDRHPETLCIQTPERTVTCKTSRTEDLLLAFRLPILILNGLLLLYLFWIIGKLTNPWIALWSTLLAALSPILIGMSQIINPDALLWSFSAGAIFSYFALLKFHTKKYLFLAGGMLGAALLSKYTASLLIPFFLMLAVCAALRVPPSGADTGSALAAEKKNLLAFFQTLAIALLGVAIFLPATWIKPAILGHLLSGGATTLFILIPVSGLIIFSADALLLQGRLFSLLHSSVRMIGSWRYSRALLPWSILLLFAVLLFGRAAFPDWNLFARIPFDLKNLSGDVNYYGPVPTLPEAVLLETNPLVFSLSPVLLLCLIIGLSRRPRPTNDSARWEFESTMLLFFLALSIVVLIFMDILAIPRYLISLYPLLSFLAALGVWRATESIAWPQMKPATTLVIFLGSIMSLLAISPFYLNYTNFLLPKSALVSDAWGYGGYEAAQYLNALPDAERLLIWSDYEGVCEFFKGKCMTKQYKYSARQSIDYAVITRRGAILYNPEHIRWQKAGNLNMSPAYRDPHPDWQLLIGDRPGNFIKVVKVTQ